MIPPFGPAITPAHFCFRSAVEHFFGKVKAGCPDGDGGHSAQERAFAHPTAIARLYGAAPSVA
jgi:hypothetical protein